MRRVDRIGGLALATALALLAGGRAEAQWGGGYGFGAGYGFGGWGGGYGMFGNMGMSLYDQEAVKQQYFMNGMARFNMQNAMAEQAYSSANLMQQQAVNTALENQRLAYSLAKERYDVRNSQATSAQFAQANQPSIPLDQLMSRDGKVLWPEYAPSGGVHGERRARADQAIAKVVRDLQSTGQAPVGDLVDARRRLHDYGQPALNLLGARNESATRAQFRDFLNALDANLEALGNPPPAQDQGGQGQGGQGQNQAPPPPKPGS